MRCRFKDNRAIIPARNSRLGGSIRRMLPVIGSCALKLLPGALTAEQGRSLPALKQEAGAWDGDATPVTGVERIRYRNDVALVVCNAVVRGVGTFLATRPGLVWSPGGPTTAKPSTSATLSHRCLHDQTSVLDQ